MDDPAFPKEHFRIVVKQGNVALRKALDTGLAAIQADGSYASIYRKWFRPEPPVVPKLHKVARDYDATNRDAAYQAMGQFR